MMAINLGHNITSWTCRFCGKYIPTGLYVLLIMRETNDPPYRDARLLGVAHEECINVR
jgi:hypothetical protein